MFGIQAQARDIGHARERGSALMIVMILCLALLGLVAATAIMSQTGAQKSEVQQDETLAVETAQIGVNQAVMKSQAASVQTVGGQMVGFVGGSPDSNDPASRTFTGTANGVNYTVKVTSAYLAQVHQTALAGAYKSISKEDREDPTSPLFDIYEINTTTDGVGANDLARTVKTVVELRKKTLFDNFTALYIHSDEDPEFQGNSWLVDGANHDNDPNTAGVPAIGYPASVGHWDDLGIFTDQEAQVKSILKPGGPVKTGEYAYKDTKTEVREVAATLVGHPQGQPLTPYLDPDPAVVDEILSGRLEDHPGHYGTVDAPQVTYIRMSDSEPEEQVGDDDEDEPEDDHAEDDHGDDHGDDHAEDDHGDDHGDDHAEDDHGDDHAEGDDDDDDGTSDNDVPIEGAGVLVVDGNVVFPKNFTFHGVVIVLGDATTQTDDVAPDHAEDDHAEDDHAEDDHAEDDHAEDDHAEDDHAEDDHAEDDHAEDDHAEDDHAEDDHAEDDHAEDAATTDTDAYNVSVTGMLAIEKQVSIGSSTSILWSKEWVRKALGSTNYKVELKAVQKLVQIE